MDLSLFLDQQFINYFTVYLQIIYSLKNEYRLACRVQCVSNQLFAIQGRKYLSTQSNLCSSFSTYGGRSFVFIVPIVYTNWHWQFTIICFLRFCISFVFLKVTWTQPNLKVILIPSLFILLQCNYLIDFLCV